MEAGACPEYDSAVRAIELYFIAHANSHTGDERYKALCTCFETLKRISDRHPKPAILSTFARVAAEMGFRDMAVQAIVKQLQMINPTGHVQLGEPFLPACTRFDRVDPDVRLNDWFLASLLEAFETLNSYSSFYTGQSTLENLEVARKLGFQSPEMERRRQLIRMRYGIQAGPVSSPLLAERTEFNLNPELWNAVH